MNKSQFIQEALANHKKGSLHKQLGVPAKQKIPITVLNKIVNAKVGETIHNPTSVGKKSIKVTRLLERRVILANTLRKIRNK